MVNFSSLHDDERPVVEFTTSSIHRALNAVEGRLGNVGLGLRQQPRMMNGTIKIFMNKSHIEERTFATSLVLYMNKI